MSNKKPTLWQKLFGAQTESHPSGPPDNDAFSVVTGNLVTAHGGIVAFSTVVPTVFSGGLHSFDSIDIGEGGTAYEETILFAEELAQEQYPGCRWQDESQIEVRDATEQEQQWALANGVNKRFGV